MERACSGPVKDSPTLQMSWSRRMHPVRGSVIAPRHCAELMDVP